MRGFFLNQRQTCRHRWLISRLFQNGLAATLPLLILYAQFPIEGLLARFALRGRVTVARVLGQVLFLHLMGALELWLISGPWGGR